MDTKDKILIETVNSIFNDAYKNFNIEFWNGEKLIYSQNPSFTIKFLDRDIFLQLVTNPNIMSFATAFIDKKLDIEGNIFDAIKLKDYISNLEISNRDKITLFFKTTSIHRHTKHSDMHNISYHYDISNKFYELFLKETMVYSCAYFKDENNDITKAQHNKMDYICKKLQLQSGERFLDIGCGWGSMIMWATKHYGVKATGVTISKQQYEYAVEKIKDENLEDRCTVKLLDYRDIEGEAEYDKIVSIGMFEHVGIKNLPTYFNTVNRLLKDNGIFLNHGITVKKDTKLSKNEGEFIQKYIFPGGELKNISYILDVMEDSKFDILDVECLRKHYYKTLKCWVENLQSNSQKAIEAAGEYIYRTWLLYMTGCAVNFEADKIAVYQILVSKEKAGFLSPLTRDYMYRE